MNGNPSIHTYGDISRFNDDPTLVNITSSFWKDYAKKKIKKDTDVWVFPSVGNASPKQAKVLLACPSLDLLMLNIRE